ncbi:leucine-rich repeat-containing G-protein coupled receptor 5 isoform X6 [Neophocaena asiaeorientalis asiaeorientalis]|uniref:Leucine-rich repeat-containing G-protein coupled receptor 5 isoform X6 n=1 Tax=Neophocaena asiaeorientalis asiaeorientalis TaxID=1706337 RepID=A0A341ASM0_NEOAA|nr:leucine-rich repeat-containing G-protein coupled receptor 5 isoform X6 [Neophocaena asiaeorientalis asiaeorientalis]
MDTSSVGLLLALPVLLQLAAGGGSPRPGALLRGCPAHCQCEPDGRMLLRVDCSDLGLSELPSNLSVFTSYLDLSMNNISQLPPNPLHGLRFLEELRLAGNALTYIPKGAFAGLYSLKVLMLQNNRLRQVPTEALQNLRSLQSLTLNGASQITEFPDLTGTASLESLTLTGAQISSLPQAVCDQLPNLQVLDLSYNLLEDLPSFSVCRKLQKIDLRHNEMCEIRANTFQQLFSLRSLNLAWNKIAVIHPNAFSTLPSLRKLDLSSNRLSSFPVTGLHGLTHLKLTGNHALQSLISSENFPELKVIEMPYAYQCCAFGVCENVYKISNQWNKGDNSSADDLHKKDAGMFQVQDERDLEDFLLDFEEDLKALHSVQCSPSPGPFKLCEYLFGSWLIRIGVWTIAVLALTCNALVTSTVFRAPLYISSVKLLIGLIAVVNMLTGVSSAVLAGVDAFTFGSFAQHGAWWEQGVGCQVVGFLSIFASESSVFLLTLAALERGFSVKCSAKFETKTPFSSLKAIVALCAMLAATIAAVPLLGGSEYSASPLCLPLPFGEPSATGYMVALVLLNSLCFLVMTIAYTKLYCNLEKGDLENIWDCSMVKHIALLLFTNCILYCPVAFLSFSSLLNLTFISPEVIKFILLVIVPLPACLNPLLYILFNPHFKEDLGSLGKQTHFWTRSKHTSLMSINSDDVEKQSCDSTQALVTFTSASRAYDLPSNSGSPPAYPMTESCHLSSVAFVPCL